MTNLPTRKPGPPMYEVGQKINMLTITKDLGRKPVAGTNRTMQMYETVCTCGETRTVNQNYLTHTKSPKCVSCGKSSMGLYIRTKYGKKKQTEPLINRTDIDAIAHGSWAPRRKR